MKHERIMGIPVDYITYDSVMNDVEEFMTSGLGKMIIASVNPQIMVEAKKYPEAITFIEKSTHRIPDGIGIVIASKLTGGKITERVTGFDLMIKLLEYGDKNKQSAFFYGAKPEVLKDALKNIKLQYPGLVIAGGIDGYTSLSDEEVVERINVTKPDFLFVAMGFPRQELWLNRNIPRLDVKVFQDVGGSFDVLSGNVKRAPQVFLDYHLEWLYRSLSDPKRIGRIFQLPVFLVKSLWWKLRNSGN